MFGNDQLEASVTAAKNHFALLRKKYPALKAYLVLSLPTGQTGIDSTPTQILKEFVKMVVDDSAKANALKLTKTLKSLAEGEAEAKRLNKELEEAVKQLEYDQKCQVELRFNDLNYDLIEKLQLDDELVDRTLTPQTRASIRIVLGTIGRFASA